MNVAALASAPTVLFFYPRTGEKGTSAAVPFETVLAWLREPRS